MSKGTVQLRYTGKTGLRRYNGKALVQGALFDCDVDDVEALLTIPEIEMGDGATVGGPVPMSEEPTPAAGRNPTTDGQE